MMKHNLNTEQAFSVDALNALDNTRRRLTYLSMFYCLNQASLKCLPHYCFMFMNKFFSYDCFCVIKMVQNKLKKIYLFCCMLFYCHLFNCFSICNKKDKF